MSIFSRMFSSLFLAGGLGAGPYLIAVGAGGTQTPAEIAEEASANHFGKTCLLGEELCEILEDESDETDDEEAEGDPKWDIGPDNIKPQKDDFCSWGFNFSDLTGLDTLLECSPEPKSTEGSSSSKKK